MLVVGLQVLHRYSMLPGRVEEEHGKGQNMILNSTEPSEAEY